MDLAEFARQAGRRDAADWQAYTARRRGFHMRAETAGTVTARLEADRWLADCPCCPGAELVAPGVPFFCMSCGMSDHGGRPAVVVFPARGGA